MNSIRRKSSPLLPEALISPDSVGKNQQLLAKTNNCLEKPTVVGYAHPLFDLQKGKTAARFRLNKMQMLTQTVERRFSRGTTGIIAMSRSSTDPPRDRYSSHW
jgi:hypothetical protein